jgi:serine/threonine-protein kinase
VTADDRPRSRPKTLYDKRALALAVQTGVVSEEQIRGEDETLEIGPDGDALDALVEQGKMSRESADEIRRGIGLNLVPGYEIEHVVGRGGMGVVYRAVQTELGRPVALKLVDPAQARNMRFVDRFRAEAQALGKLNHANIAQVYDAGNVDGQAYIAMEFVDGKDCDTLLEDGPFSESMALSVIHDAALALSHALSAGIIHRDVKPANLMLTQGARDARGSGGTATKVTDLGLAQLAGEQSESRLTQAGAVVGTPPYMAPEQLFEGEADFRVDIYGLGATLYHLITGEVPFEGRTVAETIVNKRGAYLADPRRKARHVSDGCIRVLDRMLARDPDERYGDYKSLERDIESVLDGRDPAAEPLSEDHSSIDWGDVADTSVAEAAAAKITVEEAAPSRAWIWIVLAVVGAIVLWLVLGS